MTVEFISIAALGAASRLFDMPVVTLRSNFMNSDKIEIGATTAFFEQFIYLMIVMGPMIKAVSAPTFTEKVAGAAILSLGYAVGMYIGGLLSRVLNPGIISFTVTKRRENWEMADELRALGYSLTTIPAYGAEGASKETMLITVTGKKANELREYFKLHESDVYVEETKKARSYSLPGSASEGKR